MTGIDKKTGAEPRVTADEHPRPETTLEQLAKLKPAFSKAATATVTAGNASGLNDGSTAVLLVASEQAIKELGLTPRARYVTGAARAGVEPSYMGLGPIPASKKALRAGRPDRRSRSISPSSTRRSPRRRSRASSSSASTPRR